MSECCDPACGGEAAKVEVSLEMLEMEGECGVVVGLVEDTGGALVDASDAAPVLPDGALVGEVVGAVGWQWGEG